MEEQNLTLGQTVGELQQRLTEYIEAAYHIRDRQLVEQRRKLLEEPGVIHQQPFVESTPRYTLGDTYEALGLEVPIQGLLESLCSSGNGQRQLFYNPPYEHQSESLKAAHIKGNNLVVTTGTGSGKTECFLLPMLAGLAREATNCPESFAQPAVRVILLYPMNALVNDQVGRLRLLLGDDRVTSFFKTYSGRPARFARYTSRTPYAGVRDKDKDQKRINPMYKFYVGYLDAMQSGNPAEVAAATKLVSELQARGKWPAKSDLRAWFGRAGTSWQDRRTGEFLRAVTQPDDVELLTRHEVLASSPDVLVTNYSMLEYMLMRPIEAPVFDSTASWLKANPDERLLLVVDEAHLYRGAGGSEVALLLRRLRMRLGVNPGQVQAICTSASFEESEHARDFASQLTGLPDYSFDVLRGQLRKKHEAPGTNQDAQALAGIDLGAFYRAESDEHRMPYIRDFLAYRGTPEDSDLGRSLLNALEDFEPLGLLVNATMESALPVDHLGELVFPDSPKSVSDAAVTSLMGLASLARAKPGEPSLLPCRVHSFHRGLPGLWVCMDPECSALPAELRGGPAGKLYSQPREFCECGARVLELYTCRSCGTAYAKAYTDDVDDPEYLWGTAGQEYVSDSGTVRRLQAVDLLLEEPLSLTSARKADYDMVTGRVDPDELGPRNRSLFLPVPDADADDTDAPRHSKAEFARCAVCDGQEMGRSFIQDHQTKGDEPFQALLAKQIEVQPPGPNRATRTAPLRGRKVLVFSDSRQAAARLAPKLQRYATKDAVRPLLVYGYSRIQETLPTEASLDDAYFALLVASSDMKVIIDPEVTEGAAFLDHMRRVDEALEAGALDDPDMLIDLHAQVANQTAPPDLIRAVHDCLSNSFSGIQSLALGSVREHRRHRLLPDSLPDIEGLAEDAESKRALMRVWLNAWRGYWIASMPQEWWAAKEVKGHKSGDYRSVGRLFPSTAGADVFRKQWLPVLLRKFCDDLAGTYRMRGAELALDLGPGWGYCSACRNVQRPLPGSARCTKCGKEKVDAIDPDADPVFAARKKYYRSPTTNALLHHEAPLCLRAEEHTAQLNAAASTDAFSRAERYELLFQDIDLGSADGRPERAVDVLSCTTTMEVGIDIGSLSGVSLRNMPPARSNYQQRAGRAGRRGDSVATVTAFGSADSHDEHYFSRPAEMISGKVEDPSLVLDNTHISTRHVHAYLLQSYLRAKVRPEEVEMRPDLFSVLGTVEAFLDAGSSLSRTGFETWLRMNEELLRQEMDAWLPSELTGEPRSSLLAGFIDETLAEIDDALAGFGPPATGESPGHAVDNVGAQPGVTEEDSASEPADFEMPPQPGIESARTQSNSKYLLDRLLYKGVLPRYAFPTDVATFYVFDDANSSRFVHEYQYAPAQGLGVALSQYAPGKSVWIDGKLWTSGALYSPMKRELSAAWEERELYFECERCGYAITKPLSSGEKGVTLECKGCGGETLGPGQYWLRPPGFAHPVDIQPDESRDDMPPLGYPTRAKLTVATPDDTHEWVAIGDRIRVHHDKLQLVVTNRGAETKGYNYCTRCGRIEPVALPGGVTGSAHQKPYPDDERMCSGGRTSTGMVLGTDFYSDVLLVSMRVAEPVKLIPGVHATRVALRTLCEALSKAACELLEIEPGELVAEFRPALTPLGARGQEAEVYLYDTLSGGAGFARMAGRLGDRLFVRALRILEDCPDGCDSSCYRCLRSYKNKFEHAALDRHLGSSLLHYVLNGELPTGYDARVAQATDLLFAELLGLGMTGCTLQRNVVREVAGIGAVEIPILCAVRGGEEFAVCVSGALTPGLMPTAALGELSEYGMKPFVLPPIDESMVRMNLSLASATVRQALGV